MIKPILRDVSNEMQSRLVIKSLICQDYLLLDASPGEGIFIKYFIFFF